MHACVRACMHVHACVQYGFLRPLTLRSGTCATTFVRRRPSTDTTPHLLTDLLTVHPQIWDMCNNFREEKTFYGHQRWVWDAVFSAETPPTNPNPTFTSTST